MVPVILVAFIPLAYRLPVIPTPPCTCSAPVVVLIDTALPVMVNGVPNTVLAILL